jgi:tetratricopeptide (TPR) repeat protein
MPEVPNNYPSSLDGPTPERAELARVARELREAAGLSIRRLAWSAKYNSPDYVGAIENPDKAVPSLGLIAAVDNALKADGRLIKLRKRAYDADMKRRDALKKLAAGTAAVALPADVLDTSEEILERIIREQVDYVDSGVADELERQAARSIAEYTLKDSAVLVPDAGRWGSYVDRLLQGEQYPSVLPKLQAVGCQYSGIRSAISTDLGDHNRARVFALESYTRANRLRDPDLRAWSRAAQACAARHAGRLGEAIELTEQASSEHSGPHVARLAFNQALTYAKLDDIKGVDNAVACGMSAQIDGTRPTHSDMALGPVDTAHAVYCAFSAYARLGETGKAEDYADQALVLFDQQVLPGRSFIRLELATALAESDPLRAAQLAQSAMAIVVKEPIASIRPHITDFLVAAQSPKVRNVPAMRDAVDATQTALRQLSRA